MSSTSSFQLARATADDIPEIVEIEYRVFTEPIVVECFMAPNTPAGHTSLVRQRQQAMKDDPCDYWIKVTDTSTGRIAAAANWKIYAGGVPEPKASVDLGWLEGEALDRAQRIWATLLDEDKKTMTGPCLWLNICITDLGYQRQGAGNMMLAWGCRLADHLALPIWVGASEAGAGLYWRHDFHKYVVRDAGGASDLGGSRMLREARKLSAGLS